MRDHDDGMIGQRRTDPHARRPLPSPARSLPREGQNRGAISSPAPRAVVHRPPSSPESGMPIGWPGRRRRRARGAWRSPPRPAVEVAVDLAGEEGAVAPPSASLASPPLPSRPASARSSASTRERTPGAALGSPDRPISRRTTTHCTVRRTSASRSAFGAAPPNALPSRPFSTSSSPGSDGIAAVEVDQPGGPLRAQQQPHRHVGAGGRGRERIEGGRGQAGEHLLVGLYSRGPRQQQARSPARAGRASRASATSEDRRQRPPLRRRRPPASTAAGRRRAGHRCTAARRPPWRRPPAGSGDGSRAGTSTSWSSDERLPRSDVVLAEARRGRCGAPPAPGAAPSAASAPLSQRWASGLAEPSGRASSSVRKIRPRASPSRDDRVERRLLVRPRRELAVAVADRLDVPRAHPRRIGLGEVELAVGRDADQRRRVVHHRGAAVGRGGEVVGEPEAVPHLVRGELADAGEREPHRIVRRAGARLVRPRQPLEDQRGPGARAASPA